jgi:hypothetical protein
MEKRWIQLFALSMMMILVSGCLLDTSRVEGEKLVVDNISTQQEESESEPDPKPELEGPIEITDYKTLKKLWEEYFYDAITTVSNTHEFDSPQDIDVNYLLDFAAQKYVQENGVEHLELEFEDSSTRLLPREELMPYIDRYFNMEEVEWDEQYYPLSYHKGNKANYLHEQNPWGLTFENVYRYPDGTISADYVEYDREYTGEINTIQSMTLKPHPDMEKQLYFASSTYELIDNQRVKIIGDYERLDSLAALMEDPTNVLQIIGETDHALFLVEVNQRQWKGIKLIKVDKRNFKLIKAVNLEIIDEAFPVKYLGDKVYHLKKTVIDVYDEGLTLIQSIDVPTHIKPLGELGYDYDPIGQRIVYSDEEGLKLYNMNSENDVLINETIPVEDNDLIDNIYFLHPIFVGESMNVIATMSGYEGYTGFLFYQQATEHTQMHSFGFDQALHTMQAENTYITMLPVYYSKDDTYIAGGMIVDLETGNLSFMPEDVDWNEGYLITDIYKYDGAHTSVYVDHSNADKNDKLKTVHAYTVSSNSIQENILQITEANVSVIGVLNDDTILLQYNYNIHENGVIAINNNNY